MSCRPKMYKKAHKLMCETCIERIALFTAVIRDKDSKFKFIKSANLILV